MPTATRQTESVSFPVWGGVAVIAAVDPGRLEPARDAALATLDEFDVACSRFREDSELSRLNASAGSVVRVGALLLEAVSAALRAARITDGDVDPTVGEALVALGYDRDFESLEDPGTLTIARVPGWRAVELGRRQSTIHCKPGVMLDLGATAKALAADHAADRAAAAADCPVLVSLSGDIAVSGGTPDGGWRIRVTDDHRAGIDAPGQWITVEGGGLATSSTTVRRWQVGETPVHHVIDPATGLPAPPVCRTASVAAGSCLDANIASTAAIVRGERAIDWLESLALPSRLVSADGHALHLAGWPADAEDLSSAGALAS